MTRARELALAVYMTGVAEIDIRMGDLACTFGTRPRSISERTCDEQSDPSGGGQDCLESHGRRLAPTS